MCAAPVLSDGSAARSSGMTMLRMPAPTTSCAAAMGRSECVRSRAMICSRSPRRVALPPEDEWVDRACVARVSVPWACIGARVSFWVASSRRNVAVTFTCLAVALCINGNALPMALCVITSPTNRWRAAFACSSVGPVLCNLESSPSSAAPEAALFCASSALMRLSRAALRACTACVTTPSWSVPTPSSVHRRKTPPRSTRSTAPLGLASRSPHMVAAIHICVSVFGSVRRSRNGMRPWFTSTRSRILRYWIRKNRSLAAFSAGFGEGVGVADSSLTARSGMPASTAAS
mmetsp:Transcript_14038/g.52608  ORF Transcript_14038/g.52608 Transcript_14038/m.52608 type:complete len:289 (+) Transcript_14038:6080-6946(+)